MCLSVREIRELQNTRKEKFRRAKKTNQEIEQSARIEAGLVEENRNLDTRRRYRLNIRIDTEQSVLTIEGKKVQFARRDSQKRADQDRLKTNTIEDKKKNRAKQKTEDVEQRI